MKRLLLLGAFALAVLVVGGFFAAREVAQSSNTVGSSALFSSSPSAFEWDLRDQDPGYSIAIGGPSEKGSVPPGKWHAADLLRGLPIQLLPSVACAALGLTPVGCGAAMPHDEVDALSYGRDFWQPMKPYWKWLFFSVAPGSTGLPGTGVNVEANCAPAEPQADEFWTSAHAALNANGQYYDGDGVACNPAQSNPGFGLKEKPASDNLDALDEFPAPVVNNMAYFSLGPGSPSLGPLGFVTGDVLAKNVAAGGPPGIYRSRAQLGLQVGDDVDAICVNDVQGDDYYNPLAGDRIWFSLTNASPSVLGVGVPPFVSGADVLAPGRVVMVSANRMGLNASDDLDALKCMQDPLQTDKAVSDVVFDDASQYPSDGPQLPDHPTKHLPYVEVSSTEPVVISVTSVEENLGSVQPYDALVGFYADIPLGCEGRWWDGSMPPPAFPNDSYTVAGDPRAPPFSAEQMGEEDLEPGIKKPGDDDPVYPNNTYEVDLHFQTRDYYPDYEELPGSTVMITRFFDLGCPTPGQYHFWFCNKVEPKDLIDPNLANNVRCEEMVVESLAATPTPTPTATPKPPTATPTPTNTPIVGPERQDPTFSLARGGAQVKPPPANPIDAADLVVRSPGGAPPPAVVWPCLAFGFFACGGGDELDALSLGRDFTLLPPNPVDPNAFLYFSVGPGSSGAAGSGVNRETVGCAGMPEPQADEFASTGNNTNSQYYDGDGAATCSNPPAPPLGLIEQVGPPPTFSDDLDAVDPLNLMTAGPPIFFSLDFASPDLAGLPAPSAASIYGNGGLPGNWLYAPAAALGLDTVGPDDIDALCINDADGNRTYSQGDRVWFSLRAGSATLGLVGATPADVLVPGGPGPGPLPQIVMPDAALGLLPGDELDALKCYQLPACIDRLGDTQCDSPAFDPDDDGCSTVEEAALGSVFDGSPAGWYDVYDVPVPAKPDGGPGSGANGTRNSLVDIGDVLAVLFYAFADDNGGPNANGVDYDTIKGVDLNGDSVNDIMPPLHPIEEGQKYDRSPGLGPDPITGIDPAGPPNGTIDIGDVLATLAQAFVVDCSGAP